MNCFSKYLKTTICKSLYQRAHSVETINVDNRGLTRVSPRNLDVQLLYFLSPC